MFTMRVDDELNLVLHDENDFEAEYALIEANRDHIGRHLAWVHHYHNAQDAYQFAMTCRQQFAKGTSYTTRIYYKGQHVGSIGLLIRDEKVGKGEIGYWLSQSATGQGIITRCTRTLLHFGFGELNLHKIIIRCATDNPKSCAVAKRLGFQCDGTLRHEIINRDQWLDVDVYSLLRDDWSLPDDPAHIPIFERPIDNEIRLRLLEPRHAPALYALIDQNRAYLNRWLSWSRHMYHISDAEQWIKQGLNKYAESDGYAIGIWYQGELVGGIDVLYMDWRDQKSEFGYWLGQAATGKGIMTRTVQHMTDTLFAYWDLNRLTIQCADGNSGSCAIAQRIGYQYEMTRREALWLNDVPHDLHVYGLLAHDWREQQSPQQALTKGE